MNDTKKYLVSYDLLNPGKDYTRLIAELERLGAARVLKSQWVLKSTNTALQLAEHIFRFMDGNDRLLVNELNTNWASYNIIDLNKAA